jgi:hypothetical protein
MKQLPSLPLTTADGRTAKSGLIDREMAFSIRVLMLRWMSEAELSSYSQRQLLMMYVEFLGCLLEDVCPEVADPEVRKWAVERVQSWERHLRLDHSRKRCC